MTVFKGTDMYIKDKLEYDVHQNMLDKYREKGYIFVRAGEPDVEIVEAPRGMLYGFRKTKQQYYIEIPIEEGEPYTVTSFKIEGVSSIPEALVQRAYPVREGEIINMSAEDWKTMSAASYASARPFRWETSVDLLEKALLAEVKRGSSTSDAQAQVGGTE